MTNEDNSPVLPRRLGLWSAIAVVVGLTIGSGIFRTPAAIATRLPGPLALVSVWVAGGLIALCGALTLAELAAAFPQTGGIYVYIRNSFGRLPAFLFGWSELTIIGPAAAAAIATTFSEYFLRVLGFDPGIAPYNNVVRYGAAAAIGLVSLINCLDIKWSALVQNATTAAKVVGLMFIIVVAIRAGFVNGTTHYTPIAPPGSRLLVNKLLNKIIPAGNVSFHERELYYVLTPNGFTCVYAEISADKIVLIPHPASGNLREEYNRNEVEIIGQVVGVLYPG